ncbi:hypothetical protein PENTCL1PPCAC_29500 [Pristionchus entomophagus]|uniref:Uncharacterized protein n=1 Tax=Pristionchus entomophagus TaxID=358040 RepID=A0AAV5ULM7_9BILA|nr:hypothetical protein PENTCL1PPCAC_29500 [Pristionchus entomophagus]
MMASSQSGSMQSYTPEQQQQMALTPEMLNGTPQQQQLTLEQQQQLTAQRQAMMQRQYSSPALTGRPPLNEGGTMNGGMANSSQMAMNQSGFVSPTYANQTYDFGKSDLQLEQHARLLRQRQHPHLSAQPRSASMGSLPLGQQQPPQYPYPYGQHPGSGPRPNGLNPYTANGTPVSNNWLLAYQTEMPPAFLNYYLPGKPHPYFDQTRRNLHCPYPAGTKDLGDRNPGEPFTFGFLPDSIYYVPANDRRHNNPGKGGDANVGSVPSTSKASPKKRGAGAAGGAAGAKKQRRTNSDQADDARFVQPYPPNPAAQQQRVVGVPAGAGMFPSTSGQSFDGFTQPALPMQPMMPHVQLQRQMCLRNQLIQSAPAYSGLAQSAQDAMQNARQQQAMANVSEWMSEICCSAQAQYAVQQQQQQQSTSGQMAHDGYQQSPNGEAMYSSEMQWRAQYQSQQPSTPTSSSASQPVFRSPPPAQQQQQSFNNGSQQPQQIHQPSSSNEQMYWNQQQ